MMKAAAGWYETTSLRHPPPCGSKSGSSQLSRMHEWLEKGSEWVATRGAATLLVVEQPMTRHNLAEAVTPCHPSRWWSCMTKLGMRMLTRTMHGSYHACHVLLQNERYIHDKYGATRMTYGGPSLASRCGKTAAARKLEPTFG
ncbi:hypothetical protein Tco_0767595 [Tanacetum coccineum]